MAAFARIATNTIRQGDTRAHGLGPIRVAGAVITERLPREIALTEQTRKFKALSF